MNQQPTILVVEDDEDDRLLLTDATNECGYPCQLVFAHDGVHALEVLQKMEFLPDLVLLDINMPCMNGFEVLVSFTGRSTYAQRSNESILTLAEVLLNQKTHYLDDLGRLFVKEGNGFKLVSLKGREVLGML